MNLLNKTYWENRYTNQSTGWDLGIASSPITDYIDQLPNKSISILIPGSGNAHEAKYLYDHGFTNIHLLDIAQQPLDYARQQLPELPQHRFINIDFFEHTGQYDLIIEQTFFCALDIRFRESYVAKTYELLNNNGILAGVLFNIDTQREEPPFGGSIAEYNNLFKNHFKIKTMETCYNSMHDRVNKELFINFIKL